MGRCADVRLALGVYVLGAAEPAERALVRAHLAWCRECREKLAELAGLPGLLRRVPAAEADKLFADEGGEAGLAGRAGPLPETAMPALVHRMARTRRNRRWLGALAAAAAVVCAAGGGIAAGNGFGTGGAPSRTVWETFSAHNDLTMAGATVRYSPTAWGVQLQVRVSGIAPGTACELRVTGSGGQKRIAGSWTVVPGEDNTWIPASSSFPASSLRDFAVIAGRSTLVSVPATGS